MRHLAREHDMLGKTKEEQRKADVLMEVVNEIKNIFPLAFEPNYVIRSANCILD